MGPVIFYFSYSWARGKGRPLNRGRPRLTRGLCRCGGGGRLGGGLAAAGRGAGSGVAGREVAGGGVGDASRAACENIVSSKSASSAIATAGLLLNACASVFKYFF